MSSENLKHFQISPHIQSLVRKRTTHNIEGQNVFIELLCVCSVLCNKLLLTLPVLLFVFSRTKKLNPPFPVKCSPSLLFMFKRNQSSPIPFYFRSNPKTYLNTHHRRGSLPLSLITNRTPLLQMPSQHAHSPPPMEERIHRGGTPMTAGIQRNHPQSLILWNQNN